jgi:hypothetical protein
VRQGIPVWQRLGNCAAERREHQQDRDVQRVDRRGKAGPQADQHGESAAELDHPRDPPEQVGEGNAEGADEMADVGMAAGGEELDATVKQQAAA